MPKTYNARQIADMKAQDAHSAPLPDTPDLTRHIRFFSSEEIAGLVDRIESRVAADKPTHLKPDTAHLAAKALRAWANTIPSRHCAGDLWRQELHPTRQMRNVHRSRERDHPSLSRSQGQITKPPGGEPGD